MSYGSHHMEFALFPNLRRAARAKQIVEHDAGAEAELLTDEHDLTEDRLPLCLTMARFGTLIGAAAVAAMFTAGFVGTIGLEFGAFKAMLVPPVISILTLALLAGMLGALAGALSFSTEAHGKLRRVRGLLRRDKSLPDDEQPAALLLQSTDDIDAMLRDEGALATESLT